MDPQTALVNQPLLVEVRLGVASVRRLHLPARPPGRLFRRARPRRPPPP